MIRTNGNLGRFVVGLAVLLASLANGAELLRRGVISPDYQLPADGRVKIAFFDADETLRVSRAGATTAIDPRDVVLLPFVAEKVAAVSRQGYLVAIVSNQAWVPKRISADVAEAALAYTTELLGNAGAVVHYFDFGEPERQNMKPGEGMARSLVDRLADRFGKGGFWIDWDNSFMVGDAAYEGPPRRHPDPVLWRKSNNRVHQSRSDKGFAENLKISFFEAKYYFGWKKFKIDTFQSAAEVEAFWRNQGCALAYRGLGKTSP